MEVKQTKVCRKCCLVFSVEMPECPKCYLNNNNNGLSTEALEKRKEEYFNELSIIKQEHEKLVEREILLKKNRVEFLRKTHPIVYKVYNMIDDERWNAWYELFYYVDKDKAVIKAKQLGVEVKEIKSHKPSDEEILSIDTETDCGYGGH